MPDASRQALVGLRVLVAGLLFIHGLYRLLSGGVAPFGEFLSGVPIPFGPAVAWVITLTEIVGHAREGWFAVVATAWSSASR